MKNYTTEIKWGIIFFIMSLLWMVYEKFMGWHDSNIEQHPIYTNLFAIPAIVIYVVALLEKRKRWFEDKMTWKQGFKTGAILTLVITILSPLGQYLTHEFISPDYFTNVREYVIQTGKMSEQEAHQYFNLQAYMFQATGGALVMGLITSMIVALFIKKK